LSLANAKRKEGSVIFDCGAHLSFLVYFIKSISLMSILPADQIISGVIQHIGDGPLPEPIRSYVLRQELIQTQEKLFLCIAQAFVPAFPGVNPTEQIKVNALIYLGARGIYEADPVLDNQVEGKSIHDPLMRSQFCTMEAVRILSGLFPADSPFWPQYYARYADHFDELKESGQTDKKLGQDAYTSLLAKKYALLYLVLDTWHYLTDQKNKQAYEDLQQAVAWFTIGYNIPNEIRGLKTDLETHVNNYAYWRLLELLPEMGLSAADFDQEELHKLVYVSGLAERMLTESLAAFEQTMTVANQYDLNLFKQIVLSRMESNQKEMDVLQEELSLIF
jgi:hypothetical protein